MNIHYLFLFIALFIACYLSYWKTVQIMVIKVRINMDNTFVHKKRFISPVPITLNLYKNNIRVNDIIIDLWKKSKKKIYINDNLFEFAYRNVPPSSIHELEYITLQQAITMYQVNNTVLLMLTDNGYINQFINTYVSSNLGKYPNLIVVCINDEAYKMLFRKEIHCAFVNLTKQNPQVNTKKFDVQGSSSFNSKLQWKLNIILAALQSDVKVLYMDSDIFLERNPFPYLNSFNGLDFVAQRDLSVCTGFLYFWPTQSSFQLLDVARNIRWLVDGDDQKSIITVLKVISGIHYKLLPSKLFMSGKVFFSHYQHYWDYKNYKPIMWHNNYVRSEILKNYRAKEMGFYKLDINKEYSSTTNRYFTINQLNLLSSNSKENHYHLKTILQRMIEICNTLNRSLVIPPILCHRKNSPFCNICAFDGIQCYYNIIKKAIKPFKESIFFVNPKVPQKYRDEYKRNIIYDFSLNCKSRIFISKYPPYYNITKSVVCIPCLNGNIIQCIRHFFQSNNDNIIEVMNIE